MRQPGCFLTFLIFSIFSQGVFAQGQVQTPKKIDPLFQIGNTGWSTDKSKRPILVSPDGDFLFVSQGDHIAQLRTANGQPIASHAFIPYFGLFFASKTNTLIGWNTSTVALLDLTTGKLTTHRPKNSSIKLVALSPDETKLAMLALVNNVKTFRVYELENFKALKSSEAVFKEKSDPVFTEIAWTSDNKSVYLAGSKTRDYHQEGFYHIDAATGNVKRLPQLRLNGSLAKDLLQDDLPIRYTGLYVVNRNRHLLVFDSKGRVILVNTETGQVDKTILHANAYMRDPVISADGRMIAVNLRYRTVTSDEYNNAFHAKDKAVLPMPGRPYIQNSMLNCVAVIDLAKMAEQQSVIHVSNRMTGRLAIDATNRQFFYLSDKSMKVEKVAVDFAKVNTGNTSATTIDSPVLHTAAIHKTHFVTLEEPGILKLWGKFGNRYTVRNKLELKRKTNTTTRINTQVLGNGRHMILFDTFNKFAYLIDLYRFQVLDVLEDHRYAAIRDVLGESKDSGLMFRNETNMFSLSINGSRLKAGKSFSFQKEPLVSCKVDAANGIALYKQSVNLIDLKTGKTTKSLKAKPLAGSSAFQKTHGLHLNVIPGQRKVMILYDQGFEVVDTSNEQVLHSVKLMQKTQAAKRNHLEKSGYDKIYPVNDRFCVLTDQEGGWELWDYQNGTCVETGKAHVKLIRHVTFLDEQHMITSGWDNTGAIWQIGTR